MHHKLVLIDQSQLRPCQREGHTSHVQSPAWLPLEPLNDCAHIPTHELGVPIDLLQRARHDVLFLAALIVWAKGSIHSGLAPVGAGGLHADSIIS